MVLGTVTGMNKLVLTLVVPVVVLAAGCSSPGNETVSAENTQVSSTCESLKEVKVSLKEATTNKKINEAKMKVYNEKLLKAKDEAVSAGLPISEVLTYMVSASSRDFNPGDFDPGKIVTMVAEGNAWTQQNCGFGLTSG